MFYKRNRSDGMIKSNKGRFYYKPDLSAVVDYMLETSDYELAYTGKVVLILRETGQGLERIETDININDALEGAKKKNITKYLRMISRKEQKDDYRDSQNISRFIEDLHSYHFRK